jgi:hypothetical protein
MTYNSHLHLLIPTTSITSSLKAKLVNSLLRYIYNFHSALPSQNNRLSNLNVNKYWKSIKFQEMLRNRVKFLTHIDTNGTEVFQISPRAD